MFCKIIFTKCYRASLFERFLLKSKSKVNNSTTNSIICRFIIFLYLFFNRLFLFFCCETSTLDAVIFSRFFSKKSLHSGMVETPCHTTWHAPIMCCCVATYLLNSGHSVYSCWGVWSSSYTWRQTGTYIP